MDKQKTANPAFSNEQEEQEFWATHDSSEYVEWENAKPTIFSELKPTAVNNAQPTRQEVRNKRES